MDPNLVGVRECARQLGVNASTISRQVHAGIIPNRGSETEPLVDVEEARAARSDNLDRSKQRGPLSPLFGTPAAAENPSPPRSLDDEGGALRSSAYQSLRADREQTEGQLKKIELEEKLGNLLDKVEVTDAFFAIADTLKRLMEVRRITVASRIAGMTEQGAIMGVLADEDLKMQQRVVEEFARLFGERADAAAA